MANEISDERLEEIHAEYYKAKDKMRDVIRRVAVVYFSRTNYNTQIERAIGSLLKWSNSDWESIEERTPNQMVATPIMMKIILENLLKDMVAYHCLTEQHAKEFLA